MEFAPFRSQLESTGDPVNWTTAEHGATLSFSLARDRTRSSSRRSELERALKEWLTLFHFRLVLRLSTVD